MAEMIPSLVDSLRNLAQRIVLVLLALYLAGTSANAQPVEPTFTQIVVFGDSYSDAGNVRDRTDSVSGGSVNYPSQTFNYCDGRFTNSNDTEPSSVSYVGVWHEQLARTFLQIPPATYSLSGGTDFAFGGATTANGSRDVPIVPTPLGDLVITIDDMGKQMDDYFATHTIDPSALYVVWGGANDIFADDNPDLAVAAATRVVALVNRLAGAGAQNIMVPNLPPLGDIPASTDAGEIRRRNSASANFRKELNANLTSTLSFLAPQGVTPNIYRVDIWMNMIRLLCNPTVNGFTNTTGEAQGNSNANPDHFVFWDGVHPTTAGHYWMASSANETLTTPFTPPGKALNISTRVFVDTGERVSIAGFIVSGAFPKRILIRGIGPSLSTSGVPNPLLDPTLTLFGESGNQLLANDNWRDTQETEIARTGIPPQNDLESAIVVTLSPGRYTALLAGKDETVGNGLVEVYDLDPDGDSSLANLSTRGFVGADDNAMIGGVVIGSGANPLTVVRAIGPSLAGAAITNPLLDPIVELHDGDGNMIGLNDNWQDGQLQAAQATELAPTDDRESVIVSFLAPGNYTAVVRGAGGTTGVAVVEAYRIP
jgi:phospholipase/lecithinase/hemolysin